MSAQKKRETRKTSSSRASGKGKPGLLGRFFCNKMVRVLLVASVICFGATMYVGAYARFTRDGYRKAELLAQLRDLNVENERLEVGLTGLRQPERVAAFAVQNGMSVGDRMVYLEQDVQPSLAQNAQE
ncbi:MAG: hypothetical protein KBC96_07670 [Armatimonadetes bacterium]|nr:hypothetical protein [Armatimonadota bacterium]